MIKEFIPYEQALELKELGFDEPCCTSYDYDGILQSIWNVDWDDIEYEIEFSNTNDVLWNRNSTNKLNYISAPLYQQAFRFFREKYNLYHWIEPVISTDKITTDHCCFNISSKDGYITYQNCKYYSYSEAEHVCLKKLIELVKNK